MTVFKNMLKIFIHILFAIGWTTGLLAFFEQCNDNGHPLWSTVLGAPFLHHGYYGFIAMLVAWVALTMLRAWKK